MYGGENNGKLRNVVITRQVVQDETDRLKKNKSSGIDEIFSRAKGSSV